MLSRIVGGAPMRLAAVPSTTTSCVARRVLSTSSSAARRPLSPHLTIYKMPFNAVTSVGFRATGILLTVGACPLTRQRVITKRRIRFIVRSWIVGGGQPGSGTVPRVGGGRWVGVCVCEAVLSMPCALVRWCDCWAVWWRRCLLSRGQHM